MDSTVKEGKFQGGEGGEAKRASLGEVEGNVSRGISRVLVSLQVWPNLKWERSWETKSRLYDDKAK